MLNRLFFLFLIYLLSSHCYANKLVIVIDDIGYRISDAQALNLPGNITYSVLPHTPFGTRLANQAQANQHDVLLHIPMESTIGKKLGPGGLTTDMDERDFRATLDKAFAEIPFAIGINNHMGSKLTQLYSPMAWTMRYLKSRNAIFLDSMTTNLSKGQEVATLFEVPNLRRHVFLDNLLTEAYIQKQFQQAIRIAKKHGHAIAIAHPHPETVKALTKLIPTLDEHQLTLVPISDLFPSTNVKSNRLTDEETIKIQTKNRI